MAIKHDRQHLQVFRQFENWAVVILRGNATERRVQFEQLLAELCGRDQRQPIVRKDLEIEVHRERGEVWLPGFVHLQFPPSFACQH